MLIVDRQRNVKSSFGAIFYFFFHEWYNARFLSCGGRTPLPSQPSFFRLKTPFIPLSSLLKLRPRLKVAHLSIPRALPSHPPMGMLRREVGKVRCGISISHFPAGILLLKKDIGRYVQAYDFFYL